MQNCARIALDLAKQQDGMGVVVDADGLFLVAVCLVVLGVVLTSRTTRRLSWTGLASLVLS